MHRPPAAAACLAAALSALVFTGCAKSQPDTVNTSTTSDSAAPAPAAGATAPNALSAEEQGAGWRLLFDGRSTAGWRAYKGGAVPAGWQVIDGSLVHVKNGGDIVTEEEFGNFELAVDWKVAPAGNSGIFYRATEDAERIYESAIEMQVLDDAGHVDGKSPLTSAGALYAMYPAPRGAVKAAGEWNQARIVSNGAHVEHWLNGVKTAKAEIGSADWNAKVAASKFAEWPGFAKAQRGRIGLQDHEDRVEFRNIRIRVLP
jgi:hypothetical protein